MIQQINNSKANKQLSISDMKRIVFAGGLNLFHTNSMFYPYPLGTTPHAYFQYVKRVDSNTYNYQNFWVNAYESNSSSSPATLDGDSSPTSTKTLSQITEGLD